MPSKVWNRIISNIEFYTQPSVPSTGKVKQGYFQIFKLQNKQTKNKTRMQKQCAYLNKSVCCCSKSIHREYRYHPIISCAHMESSVICPLLFFTLNLRDSTIYTIFQTKKFKGFFSFLFLFLLKLVTFSVCTYLKQLYLWF